VTDHCALGQSNPVLGGSGTHLYLPIFPSGGTNPANPIGANIVNNALENNGLDLGASRIGPIRRRARLTARVSELPTHRLTANIHRIAE
jgi:hypothetical protein